MNRRKFLITAGSSVVGLAGLSLAAPQIIDQIAGENKMKKILVITGSPRRKGNSDLLADAFISGAKASGCEVVKFETAFRQLDPCQACDNCFKTEDLPCIFKDDFNELAKEMVNANIIVFSTPLYWSSYPSNLKNAIDKFYSFYIGNQLKSLEYKKVYLLAVGEDSSKAGFSILEKTHKGIVDYHKWIDAGQLIVPGVIAKGDIKKTNALVEAEIMGKAI